MYPTVTVEHLSSVPTATDDSDDMKIYQFDREASMDWTWIIGSTGWTTPGDRFQAHEDVLAA
ncbi:hypothetical protein OG205_22530 [Lentzea sp. NBC_00516]|uniref:hypothetical protein n=1 Tax=Lentzea sp. NBC_00516 TaxID=2903582 RepID=UPI002E81C078|nr:hypothetical protein [Lentzea sp. NBC_00516]WUD20931.1 hypothetical protein OG205_22530 [Lentzea sp. NBC_00516]